MQEIITFLEYLMSNVSLELFVFIGTCIDEIISPIPAFLVLIPAGVAAHLQHMPVWYLGILALISGVARAASGYVLYVLADKLEDVLFARNRKFFGYSHRDIETYGKKLSGSNRVKSWWLLFLMHALPVFPGTLLSLGSGFIRLPVPLFLTSTAAGSTVVAALFLYLGYAGIQTAEIVRHLDKTAQFLTLLLIVTLIGWLAWRQYSVRRRKKT